MSFYEYSKILNTKEGIQYIIDIAKEYNDKDIISAMKSVYWRLRECWAITEMMRDDVDLLC